MRREETKELSPFLDHLSPPNGERLEKENEALQSPFETVRPRAAEVGTDNRS
jgi:hypothetical protein